MEFEDNKFDKLMEEMKNKIEKSISNVDEMILLSNTSSINYSNESKNLVLFIVIFHL